MKAINNFYIMFILMWWSFDSIKQFETLDNTSKIFVVLTIFGMFHYMCKFIFEHEKL